MKILLLMNKNNCNYQPLFYLKKESEKMSEYEIKALELLSEINKELQDIHHILEPKSYELKIDNETIARSIGEGFIVQLQLVFNSIINDFYCVV